MVLVQKSNLLIKLVPLLRVLNSVIITKIVRHQIVNMVKDLPLKEQEQKQQKIYTSVLLVMLLLPEILVSILTEDQTTT